MDNSFKNLVESANAITILLPQNPSMDEVAAGLSFYLALRDKKEVAVSCPTPMVVEFNRLIGVNKVSSDLGNKNLSIRFTDYEASDIERVSYDIENGQFKLTVIPKPGLSAPKQEQVEMNYSGLAGDTVILVGGNSADDFPALSSKDMLSSKIIHVGTKTLATSGDKALLSFDRPASAVSEIAYALISETGVTIDSDVSTNLLAGIEAASQGFKADGVSAETFEIVAHLLRAGGQRLVRNQNKETFPGNIIPGQAVFAGPDEPEVKENAPQDWLGPKVYKGTSIS